MDTKLSRSASDSDSTYTVAETTWGEPSVINEANAINDLVELNRILSQQSAISRSKTNDIERVAETSPAKSWLEEHLGEYVADKEFHNHPNKTLGVTFKNLTIQGVGSDQTFQETVLSALDIVGNIKAASKKGSMKNIIQNATGHVGAGEMLLVLGRPGAGCTSLLKVLANQRTSFKNVEGDVTYSGMNHKEAEQFRGQIVMNTEDELHFPTLTVEQTMDFALSLKTPRLRFPGVSTEDFNKIFKETVLKMFGITHTKDTKIGDAYIRGVSGGERKRVSIAELFTTRASCLCWDNSTRGLDASTALEYTKCLRIMSDFMKATNIVTLYQAGNKIYDLFDKVMVIESGRCVYFGPRSKAKPYFEAMGFVYTRGANVADFLTGLLIESERIIKPGAKVPNTAEEMEAIYLASDICRDTLREAEEADPRQDTVLQEFRTAAKAEKSKHTPDRDPYTVSMWQQVKSCTIRQYELMWGDKASIILKQGSTLLQALIAGSLFYNLPRNTEAGLFPRGGTLFFALLFNVLIGLTEITDSFKGRAIIQKHKHFALYRPSAIALAQVLSDIPILLFQLTHFNIVLYFMCGLKRESSAFFTFYLFTFVTTMSMFAFFRMVASLCETFNAASKIAGFGLSAVIMYTGFIIPKPSMHPWLSWLYYIDPLHYGYESLMANEFHGLTFECVGNSVTPRGDVYVGNANKGCGIPGATVGSLQVSGDDYLQTSLQFSHSHIWRNLGIILGFWIFFVAVTMFGMERQKDGASNSSLLFKRPDPWFIKALKKIFAKKELAKTEKESILVSNESIFTWDNLSYTVNIAGGKRQLLDNVKGWVKPGELTALMGSSGAGKTTLLDVLAQRKDSGEITGEILIDGRPLTVSFQRSAGYCEQLDIHEATATVREALEFSAVLRQGRDIPRAEKIAYVDTIIDLLEMQDIENAIVGVPGNGLTIEQRKRLTIGVELAAKPTLLTFLDEPTSGLDGNAAFNVLRFLRKLSEAGQSVLCTIHQPSASLFEQFDNLLLLAKGGKTVYFGPTGKDSAILNDYFARQGMPCHKDSNPAEHMIDVVSGPRSLERDWNKIWLESKEHQAVCEEIKRLKETCKQKDATFEDDGYEFAMPLWEQCKMVTERCSVALYRNNDYVSNKIMLHIGSALFNGFTFWMIGDSVTDLQNKMFTIFNFIFVSPAVINGLQPLFLQRRDLYEAREKKSKIYSWKAFCCGLIVSEIPYLIICAVLYFVCWYYTVGFPNSSSIAGPVLFQMILFEFLYTGIGQFIAAYAPSEYFASLTTPILFGTLVSFCGILVPYEGITAFWRYWLYWLNPFTYLMGGLMVPTIWDAEVKCSDQELSYFTPPAGQTCGEYLTDFFLTNPGYVVDNSTMAPGFCGVCKYKKGSDYLFTLNLTKHLDGWRDIGITVLFCFSSYAMVFILMKLRSKKTKSAKAE